MPYAHPQQKKDWYANNPNQSDKRRVRQVKSRKAKRAFIVECKNVPCMDCGVTYPHYVMDFDHREPEHKQFIISEATNYNVSWDKLKDEIAKCDVVCSNCHRTRTHKEYGGFV